MRARQWVRWLRQVRHLDAEQRAQLRRQLQNPQRLDDVTAVLEQQLASPPACPRCSHPRCVRNGHADGLQRYQCRGCKRSFNALTGTPLARLRLRAKWGLQAQALQEGFSVRRAAQHLGVHRTTAFRWRHRFLGRPCQARPATLNGVVEADETYVLRSCKGQVRQLRQLSARASRHRGGHAAKRGLSDEQIPVLVLRDRSGQSSDFVLPAPAGKADVKDRLVQALAGDAVLCTDTSATLRGAAREAGLEHRAVNVSQGERVRGAWHIQNVNAYHSRLKTWMRRFNGVATSYLAHYTGWFRALDRIAQAGGANSLSWLAFALGSHSVIR